MKNYKLILCLLVVILASVSCVAASDDVDTTIDDNNVDTSIATDDVAVSEPDEVQVVNNLDNGNNDADLYAADSGDSKVSYENNNYDDNIEDGVYSQISSDLKSSTRNVPVNSAKYANLYESTTYADNKNFTALQEALNSTTNGSTLYLNSTNYVYTNGDEVNSTLGMNISISNVIIDGSNGSDNGMSIIDGNGQSTIFNITGSNVTLKNIIFKNANSTFNGHVLESSWGGAIKVLDGSASFVNCIFDNNTVTSYGGALGGAVYLGSNTTATFNNCNFTNNTVNYNIYEWATSNGGAVYVGGSNKGSISNASFTNCIFDSNSADQGGAIDYWYANVTLINNSFTNNKATDDNLYYGGGAIYGQSSSSNLIGNNFINNTAPITGGAISLGGGNANLDDNDFVNNTATNDDGSGGAIATNGCNMNLTDSTFIGNSANTGGAILTRSNTTISNINKCSFENNTASSGGAMYGWGSVNSITGSSFTGNNASYGGVLYLNNDKSTVTSSNISDCDFSNNTASISGGVIYTNDGNATVNNSTFRGNNALTGGVLYNNGNTNVYDSIFNKNHAAIGAGVFANEGSVILEGSEFTNNTAIGNGGGLYVGTRGNATVTDSNFANNTAANGDSVFSSGDLTVFNVTSDVNIINNGVYGNATLSILDDENITLYTNFINITAVFDGEVDVEELFFNITSSNGTNSYVLANRGEDGIYYYEFYVPEFGQTYNVTAFSPSIRNLNVTKITITSIDNFILDVNAGNVTYGENNIVDVFFTNDGRMFSGNLTAYVDGEYYGDVEIDFNRGRIILTNLTIGEHNITVMYGDNNVSTTATFYVKENVTISDANITFRDNSDNTTDVTIEFPRGATGNVTVTVNGTEYNVTLINGIAAFTVNGTFPDFANVTVTYPGNNITSAFNETLILDLRKIELNITGSTVTTGDNSTVNVDLTINDVPADKNVTVTVSGTDYEEIFDAEIVNGTGIIDLGSLAPGVYNVTVQYSNKIVSTVVYVKNNITIDDVTIEASENADGTANLTVTVPESMTGNITFTVGSKNYTAEIINGSATVSTDQLYDDAFNVTVSYEGDDVNYPFNYTYTFDTTQINVTVENVTMYFDNGSGVVVNVAMGDTPVANQTVTITINNVTRNYTTDENGTAKVTIHLIPGVYNVTTTYVGSDGQEYTVESMVTVLSTINGDNIVKYYGNGTRYYASFVDGEGNPLANTNVTFNIHGVFYNRTTDENGTASLGINLLPGDYIITAYNPVNNQSFSNNITVLNTLNTSNLVKYFRNGSQFSASVVDGAGNAVEGATVTFNINGVFYNRTTGVDGVATLNINLNPGDYTITTYNTLTGQSMGNTVKVLPVLTGEDLTKVYGQSGSYVAHLVDSQGNPYANQQVTFNIHGRMYTTFTNANGDASLAINLLPGRYVITAYAGSASNSNIITVVGGA